MGYYTEIYVNVRLKKDAPKSVIETLQRMTAETEVDQEFEHEFRESLFWGESYYHPGDCIARFTFDKISGSWSLTAKSSVKYADREIESFFEWLAPHVEKKWTCGSPTYMGHIFPEDAHRPAQWSTAGALK